MTTTSPPTAPARAPGGAGASPGAALTVMVPILNIGAAPEMIELAATLAAGPRRMHSHRPAEEQPRVVVLGVVRVPPDEPISHGMDMARSYRALLDFLPSEVQVGECKVRVDRVVRVARDVASAVRRAADEEEAGLVLFYWKGYASHPKRHTYGSIIDACLTHLPCDVVLARPDDWREARRVLLPVRGGPSAERALDLALLLAETLELSLTVMHNVPTTAGESSPVPTASEREGVQAKKRGEEPYIVFSEHLARVRAMTETPIYTVLTLGDDPATALVGEASEDDLVVMGTSAPRPAPRDEEPGAPRGEDLTLTLSNDKGPPMMLVRAAGAADLSDYTAGARTRRVKRTYEDMPFERWFVENTYHCDEFRDPADFIRLKRASGKTISVGLLTSNDSRSLRSTLTGVKRVLSEMHPIADQIVVVDAGSSDATVEIARSLGVEVYLAEEILPAAGSLHGPGESWWKSLAVMQGDIVVWLDPRARRFHPSTAISIAGPLLRVPTLQLVKAFVPPHLSGEKQSGHVQANADEDDAYRVNWGSLMMPNREEGVLSGRIRVMPLRPADLEALSPAQIAALPPQTVVQVLYPSLSGVMAPFGRDMAARREAMLDVPALTSEYNALGVLLWTAARFGTRAVAQVELRHARPSLPPQPGLQCALDVLEVLAHRLPDPNAVACAERIAERLRGEPGGSTLAQSVYEVRDLPLVERPPLREML